MPAASATVPTSSSYTVQSGDTLGLIAARQGVSLNTVLTLNGLGMSSIIYPGQSIKIAGAPSAPAPAPAAYAAPAPTTPAPAIPAPTNAAADSSVSTLSLASSTVTRIPTNSVNATILSSAKAQLGAVQDCTVLGEQALRAAGISGVGDESPESLMRFATPVADPQPGDFIYYADGGMGFAHNAIYIGGGMAIHSGWTGNQTTTFSVNVGSGPSYYRVNA
ncbi:LysM peptidoglycan-binding domain-containing protein [Arthrobacter sp. H35-D1]|nr:LysM peptidoglycan-binding domain-containing protein [Arthrobacter sp. H35-D1]MDJ0314699.1 LysM peptidoglycan-binding domain-containing protein [Arthrobacter sp. H35-D1]